MEIVQFMTVDEIKEIGYINENVNEKVVATTLIRVQDVMLKSILGNMFYKRLRQGIIDSDLTPDEVTLIDDYIKPFLVASVEWKIIPHVELEIREKTVGTTNDSTYQTADERQTLKLEDDARRDSDHYKSELKCYLHDNAKLFPKFNEWMCACAGNRPEKLGGDYNHVIAFV